MEEHLNTQKHSADEVSEALHFGILLTIIGGFLETYSYVGRGHVFANGQTANMAKFGMNLAAGDFPEAVKYLIPIVCFAVGVYLAEVIHTLFQRRRLLHWKQAVLLLEGGLTLLTAALPGGAGDTAANVVIAIICGLQVEAFRKLHSYAYTTTMCTGNLRSATEAFYRFFALRQPEEGGKAAHYYGIILIFIFSAVLGGLFTDRFGHPAILFCLLPIGLCFLLLHRARC
ncbi:MAG: DUF1275 domain-containing protein [Clostridiales bacterium]|nr:DUF1275 domain-containing protein [Clostridiales bacterium]